ncbi:MAG: autotransporter-associated beta strand repeat-containing protein [Caulobacter sp.]|nr:autotransporter-associated beta strand repeat-containing protein [Caulobacter sp.]
MTKSSRKPSMSNVARLRLALLGSTAFMSLAASLPVHAQVPDTRVEAGTTTTLVANDQLTGGLVMAGGTLAMAGWQETMSSLTGSGSILLQNGALSVDQAINSTYSGDLDVSGADEAAVFEKRGLGALSLTGRITGGWGTVAVRGGALAITGDNDFTGQVDLYGGTLLVGRNTALGASEIYAWQSAAVIEASRDVVLSNNIVIRSPSSGSLTIGGDYDIQLDGSISGAGRKLVKQGAGALILNNYNSYNGTLLQQGTISVIHNQGIGLSQLTASQGTTLKLADGIALANYNPLTLAGDMTLDVAAGEATVDGVISGAGGLTKTGAGKVTLTGNNTYAGTTHFNGGTVVMAAPGALPPYGAIDFNGGKLVVHRFGRIMGALSGTSGEIELVDPNYRLVIDQATDTRYAGAVGGTGIFAKQGTGSLTMAGVISGDTMAVEAVQGTLVLDAANTYAGGTALDNGSRLIVGDGAALGVGALFVGNLEGKLESNKTVALANDVFIARGTSVYANLAIEGANDLRLDGVVGEQGSTGYGGVLIKRGAGVLTLAGHNTYTQGTVLSGGVVRALTNDAFGTGGITVSAPSGISLAEGLTIANAVTLDDTLTVNAEGAGAALSGDFDGAGGLQVSGGALTLTGALNYAGATTLIDDASLTLGVTATGGMLGPITLGGGTLTVNRADDFTIESLNGDGAFVQNGGGVTRLYRQGDFTGSVTIAGGALRFSDPNAIDSASSVAMTGASAVLDLSVYDIIGSMTTVHNFSGVAGSKVKLGLLGTLHVVNDGEGVFAGTIQGAANPEWVGTLYSEGTGKLTLTGQNDLRNVWVELGTLALADAGTLGERAWVSMYDSVLDLSGLTTGGATIAGVSGSSGTIALGASTLTLVDPGDEFLGSITGTGGLHLLGGWLGLTGTQAYTGDTVIDAGATLYTAAADFASAMRVEGILDIGQYSYDTAIGGLSGAGDVLLGTNKLTIKGGGRFTGAIGGDGSVRLTSGALTLTGANTYGGGTEVGGGASLLLTGSLGGGALTIDGTLDARDAAAPLTVAGLSGGGLVILKDTLTLTDGGAFSGTIQGDAGVTFAAGSSTLSGANIYTGATTVANGATLALSGGGSLANSSVTADGGFDISGVTNGVTVGSLTGSGRVSLGANTLLLGGDNRSTTFSGVIDGSGGLTKTGAGVLTLTGSNTYSGLTRVSGGTLRLGAAGVLADDSTLEVLNGAILDLNGFDEIVANFTIQGHLVGGGTLNAVLYKFLGGSIDHDLGGGAIYQQDGVTLLNGTSGGSAVHVDGGALRLGADERLADTAVVTVAAGATLDLGGFRETVGSVALGGVLAGGGSLSAGAYVLDGATIDANLRGGVVTQQSGASVLNGEITGAGVRVEGGSLTVAGRVDGALEVRGGTLTGDGVIEGGVSVADGGRLAGGSGRTLSMGALTLSSGSVVDVSLSRFSSPALFDVAGDLTLDGVLNVTALPDFGAGVYRLFDYGGRLIDNGLVLGRVEGVAAQELAVQTATAGRINLVNATGTPLAFWDGGAAAGHDNNQVDGGTGVWSLGGRNWTNADGLSNGPMRPAPGYAVFQGAGGVVTIDNGDGQVGATGMQFASNGYSLAGGPLALAGEQAVFRVGDGSAAGEAITVTISAVLTGGAKLVKTDLGTLVLTGTNTYTGGTVVQGGTLVGDASSIRGAVRNEGRVVFDQAVDATFEGAIDGSGAMVKAGGGILTLAGASSADWRVTGGSLVSKSMLFTGDADVGQGASFVFDQATDGVYAGALSGAGAVLVRGGGLVRFTGDSSGFLGVTRVGGGGADLLSVNGSLGGVVEVLTGGRLQGSGMIGAGRIAGTLAPGNSIGTLTVAGDLSFLAGSVFEVETNAAGQGDKVVVNGAATIQGGAKVSVLAANGSYAANTNYTILTAAGGVTGTFSEVTSNLAFLSPTLAYGVNAVTLNLKRNGLDFSAVAQTSNQGAVAPAVEALGAGHAVYDATVALTAAEARAAFDQLSGSDYATFRASLVEDSRFMREAMLAREQAAGVEGLEGWGRVLSSRRKVDGTAEAQGYKRSIDGFVTGMDGSFNSRWRGGVAFSYDSSEFRSNNATQKSDSYQAGGGVLGAYGAVSIQLGAAYGRHTISSQRQVAFGELSERLADKYGASTFQGFGQVAVKTRFKGVGFRPFAGLTYVSLFDADMDERGGAAALHGGQKGFETVYGELGLRVQTGWDLGGARLGLDASAALRNVLDGRTPEVDLAFARGAAFQVRGLPIDRTQAAVDLGLKLEFGSGLQLGVSYSGAYSDRSTDQGGRAELKWRF